MIKTIQDVYNSYVYQPDPIQEAKDRLEHFDPEEYMIELLLQIPLEKLNNEKVVKEYLRLETNKKLAELVKDVLKLEEQRNPS